MSISALNTLSIVRYRPPKTKMEEFNEILTKIEELLKLDKSEVTIMWSGDITFLYIEWEERVEGNGCRYKYKIVNNA